MTVVTTIPAAQPAPKSEPVKPTPTPTPEAPKPAPTLEQREAALAEREAAVERKLKVWNAETKKWAEKKNGLGEKLSRLNEYEKSVPEMKKKLEEHEQREKLRRLNPVAAFKSEYGDNWFEKLTALNVNGVPPTDIVAAEMERMRAEFRDELQKRDDREREATSAAEKRQIDESRAQVAHDATRFYEQAAKDYPAFEALGDAKRVGAILAKRIEDTWFSTAQRDESGAIVGEGKLLTPQEAADALDADLLKMAERMVKADKYKSKLQPETKAGSVVSSSGSNQGVPQSGSTRRTLDNSMTASASASRPQHRTDDEREQAARAKFLEVAQRNRR